MKWLGTIVVACVLTTSLAALAEILPPLAPLKAPVSKRALKRKRVRRPRPGPHWEYRLAATPYVQYIGGAPTQAERAGSLASFYYLYGNVRFVSEGFVEVDRADAASDRRSETSALLQEAFLEYRWEAILFRLGQQSLRWSEAWTLPSLDGWTARRFNRLFFDPLAQQLIHPVGGLVSWNREQASLDFFYNLRPAQNKLPEPLPEDSTTWRGEWGTKLKFRPAGKLDAELMYFDLATRELYGTALSYATDSLVPKMELGRDSLDTEFAILGLDWFVGKASLIPRVTSYRTRTPLNPRAQVESGTSWHLTARWDESSDWLEVQAFKDQLQHASFYSLRYGHRFARSLELTLMAQDYAGESGSLFGVFEDLSGGMVYGAKLALAL